MTKIVRVGATFPPELLGELDEAVEEMGYENRSKAIQDSVRAFITEYKWLREQKGAKAGVLVMIYDHEVKGLDDALIDTQHSYSHVVFSTMHVHLSNRECLEAIAVKGEAKEIRRLAQELAAKKGVKQVKPMIVSS
jgi:CopG family nickel-responsive transcriptional regulator